MRKDDFLPQQMRLMTDDGLRFVATYRGLIKFACIARDRGGPHSDKWRAAADTASRAVEQDDESGVEAALKTFSSAAKSEGWIR
ncbi:hypothetical protein IZ6_18430 [Terrihabitans soli]|uniref:DUF982 domain-containing protein n=1 Tax=Terrihabitans soli TaxID=708113 RepID=A0A6S6QX34_9HYPH|nr:hypothetical protein [Terrihabitans soli]BCJ91108.1 hypothetical protein IZ6_18430 [Terrihabitans soli]